MHVPQASHKLLRRTQRVLISGHSDALLAALQQQVVQGIPQQLSDALVAACAAHEQLRVAFQERIKRDTWGVIQRAFRLMCRLYREMVSNGLACVLASQYSLLHCSLVQCGLVQRVPTACHVGVRKPS